MSIFMNFRTVGSILDTERRAQFSVRVFPLPGTVLLANSCTCKFQCCYLYCHIPLLSNSTLVTSTSKFRYLQIHSSQIPLLANSTTVAFTANFHYMQIQPLYCQNPLLSNSAPPTYGQKCNFQYVGRRHLGFCGISILPIKPVTGPHFLSLCQIWCESVQNGRVIAV